MTLDKAFFLYGGDVEDGTKFINFTAVFGGPILTAMLTPGNYTATEYMLEGKRAMEEADPANTYTWTLNRTPNPGNPTLSNLVHITTSGGFLSLLFGSGPNASSSVAQVIGFSTTDRTGSLAYAGNRNFGQYLYPDLPTYNYIDPTIFAVNDGVKNVSSAGVKETLVFSQMYFAQGNWKYITNQFNKTQTTEWATFLKYATRQRKFEFTPSIEEDFSRYFQVTLESTAQDGGNGMGFMLAPMISMGLFRYYESGTLKFRLIPGTL